MDQINTLEEDCVCGGRLSWEKFYGTYQVRKWILWSSEYKWGNVSLMWKVLLIKI